MRKPVRHWIEYVKDWKNEPMAYWVHKEQGLQTWLLAESYEPAAPIAAGQKGFSVLCILSQDFIFRFSSVAQLEEFINVLSRQPLPTSKRLSKLRGGAHGPNSHWLSRLQAHIKSTKKRQRAVADLQSVISNINTINTVIRSLSKVKRLYPTTTSTAPTPSLGA